MAKVLVLLAVLTVCSLVLGVKRNEGEQHWAVLVAGSNSWYNYRHQADICHAYQILSKNGIPDERIIVFMYDDIANDPENPTPGVIINKPDGPDVYSGVPHDYVGDDVTPENFLAVLTGNSSATTGKVLQSDSDDHVFVYFADHGATDLIAFPSSELYSTDLLAALHTMHDNEMYGKLVFYLEACESGSMFVDLPTDTNIYATTAADPDESSYGFYCNVTGMPCLGDEYSIHWMEDSDAEDLSTETLDQQFKLVKQETQESHVSEYGNMDFQTESLIDFQGGSSSSGSVKKESKGPRSHDSFSVIPSREIQMTKLHMALRDEKDLQKRDDILRQITEVSEHQRLMIKTVQLIASVVAKDDKMATLYMTRPKKLTVHNKVCYKTVVSAFSENCFRLGQNEYATGLVYVFGNMCNQFIPEKIILAAISKAC